jgi:hypothetical protein
MTPVQKMTSNDKFSKHDEYGYYIPIQYENDQDESWVVFKTWDDQDDKIEWTGLMLTADLDLLGSVSPEFKINKYGGRIAWNGKVVYTISNKQIIESLKAHGYCYEQPDWLKLLIMKIKEDPKQYRYYNISKLLTQR